MRSAKNFHPVTGYGAAKGILVAMAIGAIASGEVILSLVDVRIDQALIMLQPLAARAEAPIKAPEATRLLPRPVVVPAMDSGGDDRLSAPVNESSANSKGAEPSVVANPLTRVRPNDASVEVATPPSTAAANKTTKNRRVDRHAEPRVARGGYGAWGWGGSASHLY
jgi:hypothetical protein